MLPGTCEPQQEGRVARAMGGGEAEELRAEQIDQIRQNALGATEDLEAVLEVGVSEPGRAVPDSHF